MKLRVPAIAVFLLMAVFQATLGETVSVYGIKPSLVFIFVYALSVTGGEWQGLMYGTMGGFVEDCLSGGYMGLFMSGYALAGYAAGKAGRKLFNIGESANFMGIFLLGLLQGAYTAAILDAFTGGSDMLWRVARFALPQAAYNAAAGALLLWLFKGQVARRVPWLRAIRQLPVGL